MFNNRTPASMLDVPKRQIVALMTHAGTSRRDRRHFPVMRNSIATGSFGFIPKERQVPTTNEPLAGQALQGLRRRTRRAAARELAKAAQS